MRKLNSSPCPLHAIWHKFARILLETLTDHSSRSGAGNETRTVLLPREKFPSLKRMDNGSRGQQRKRLKCNLNRPFLTTERTFSRWGKRSSVAVYFCQRLSIPSALPFRISAQPNRSCSPCISAVRRDCLSWRPNSEPFVRLYGKSKIAMIYFSHILSVLAAVAAALHTMNPEIGITPDGILKVSNMIKEIIIGDAEDGYPVLSQKQKTQTLIPDAIPFPCEIGMSRSPVRPTNVNQIRPGDIDVVAAIGDSLTTATGAAAISVLQAAREYRGLSWATGGQGTWRKYLTLPNIIKVFNPKLIGYSTSDKDLQFNTAAIGNTVKDVPYMAQEMVKRMKSDERVNVKRDWKLVEVMIGANDFCSKFWFLKEDDFRKRAGILRKYLTMALDHLRDNLPRTIVNLVMPPALDSLQVFAARKGYCNTMHYVLCPSLFGAVRARSYKANIAMQKIWQRIQEEVAADQRYRKDDFAVVVQPFFKNVVFPRKREHGIYVPDVSFLSEDCFHFSQKTHATVANAVWNNMLEPVGRKTLGWALPFARFLCPTEEHPYIFTYDNSFNYTKTYK